jgi:fatty-acyl-CoA synthase
MTGSVVAHRIHKKTATATDAVLTDASLPHIADYKLPKDFVRSDKIVRSPAGKADYRWAKALATGG